MTWLILALLAYFGLASVAVADKYLLKGPIGSPLLYAAGSGVLSLSALLLWPFVHFQVTGSQFFFDALSGGCFVIALFFYYLALRHGEASRVVPLTGAIVPLVTLILANIFLRESLSDKQFFGFLLLIIGGVIITLKSRPTPKHKHPAAIVLWSVIASVFFAVSFVATKHAYNIQPFWGALILTSIGKAAVGAVLMLVFLAFRSPQKSRPVIKPQPSTLGVWLGAKTIGASSGLAQNYAFSLAPVSLINALQGFQYAFLFILIFILGKKIPKLKERFDKKALFQKISAILILTIGLLLIAQTQANKRIEYGFTFSDTFARDSLKIANWQQTYDDILNNFNFTWVRLPAYWSEVEPQPNNWNFNNLEYEVQKASHKNLKIIIAFGQKTPRWPECNVPQWVKALPEVQQQEALKKYIKTVVQTYDQVPEVIEWQVENEPMLPFGDCPKPNAELLKQEVALVRSLSHKPVLITDSGELSTWWQAMNTGDDFGTTMYRRIYHKTFGEIYYPLPPGFYNIKAMIAKLVTGKHQINIANVELQGEPWGNKQIADLSLPEQLRLMNPEQLKNNAQYAETVGFSPTLWWGVEWWWWLKNTQNEPSLWQTAQTIINHP